jgi:hypothetical protein
MLAEAVLLTADDVELATGSINPITGNPDFLTYSLNVIDTYWHIMTFQIAGLPGFITTFVFYPVSLVIGFLGVSLIRGVS